MFQSVPGGNYSSNSDRSLFVRPHGAVFNVLQRVFRSVQLFDVYNDVFKGDIGLSPPPWPDHNDFYSSRATFLT